MSDNELNMNLRIGCHNKNCELSDDCLMFQVGKRSPVSMDLQELDEEGYCIKYYPMQSKQKIDDGAVSYSRYCKYCGRWSLQLVRPGKVQCQYCG